MGHRASALASGSITPGNETLRKPYRYQGKPGWVPEDAWSAEPDPGPAPGLRGHMAKMQAARAERIGQYAELRAGGTGVAEAARLLGIGRRTASEYEHVIRAAGAASQEPSS